MADIFLSYSRTDKPLAEPLVAALAAKGWSVWWDMDLEAGSDFDRITSDALESAKAVIVVWTPTSVNSRWVRGEARVGADRGVLVPVRFENAKLPIDVRAIHTTDLDGWEGDPKSGAFSKLEQSLAALLSGGDSPDGAPALDDAALPLPSKPSIAVMPFGNLSGDPEQDYFADGMVSDITTALSRFKSIFVIASSSAFTFKGKKVGAQDVARQLGVRYILEGSVRRAGGRIRIAVQLIDAEQGAQTWAERFDDSFDDVFALQDRVAASVAGTIDTKLAAAERLRVSQRPTENMGGYDLYLVAHGFFSAGDPIKALGLLDRAVALDPSFGRALSLAAASHNAVVAYALADDVEAHRHQGLEMARRALAIGGDDALVIAQAASVLLRLGDASDTAAFHIARALSLNPGAWTIWFFSAMLHVWLGEPDLAIEHLETAMRLDPLSSNRAAQNYWLALARFQQGRFTEALRLLNDARPGGQPLTVRHSALLAAIYGHLGQTTDARQALTEFQQRTSAPIEEELDLWLRRPEHRKLYRDGVELARGRGPADGRTGPG